MTILCFVPIFPHLLMDVHVLKAREHTRMGGMLEGETGNYEERFTDNASCSVHSTVQLNIFGCNLSGFAI